MRYREFINHYATYRRQSTPDLRDSLLRAINASDPSFNKHKKHGWSYRMIAAGAAALLIVAVTGTLFLQTNHLPVDSSNSQDSLVSVPVSVVGQLPHWYAPGKLQISPLNNEGSPLDYADGFNGYCGMYFLDLTGRYHHPGHESCSGVYYNIKTETSVCFTHEIQEALIRDGSGTKKTTVYIHFFEPKLGKVLFTITSEKGKPSFIYDINTSAFTPLRVSVYPSPGHAGGYEERLSGSPYFLAMTNNDLLLLNMETGEVTNIINIHNTLDDARLSSGGGYVLYTKASDDSEIDNSNRRTTVIYDIQSKRSRECQGEVLHMLQDDSRLVIRNPQGTFVYAMATGNRQPLSEATSLPVQYRFLLGKSDQYTEDCFKITLTDLLTNQTTAVSEKYIYTYTISRDYRYLYYYIRGENTLTCYEMATGNEFSMPVDTKFIEGTEQGTRKESMAFFFSYLDEESSTLYLGYQRTERPRKDPEQARMELENDPRYQVSQYFSKNTIESIGDMGALFEKFPGGLIAYEGKDFLFIDYSALFDDYQRMHIAYEDYRANQFYLINHEGKDFKSTFRITEGAYSIKKDERDAVQSLVKRLNLPVQAAPMDYSDFIVNGKVDETQVANRAISAQRMMGLAEVYFVRKKNYLESVLGLEGAEMEPLRTFLEFAEQQKYQPIAGDKQLTFIEKHEYSMSISAKGFGFGATMYMGKKDGDPFLLFENLIATISQADYQQWIEWMAQQSEKCKHTPA